MQCGLRLYRGPERIRTAVAAFAELSLATRPQDLVFTRDTKVIISLNLRIYPEITKETLSTGPLIGGLILVTLTSKRLTP